MKVFACEAGALLNPCGAGPAIEVKIAGVEETYKATCWRHGQQYIKYLLGKYKTPVTVSEVS